MEVIQRTSGGKAESVSLTFFNRRKYPLMERMLWHGLTAGPKAVRRNASRAPGVRERRLPWASESEVVSCLRQQETNGHGQLQGQSLRDASPRGHLMVCRWRKYSGSCKSKTNTSAFVTVQMCRLIRSVDHAPVRT